MYTAVCLVDPTPVEEDQRKLLLQQIARIIKI
jgi:hypothetical protein